jgi:hypothetical protein
MTKYLRKISLTEKADFDSQFLRFQSMVDWLHCFGPMARSNIMAWSHVNKVVHMMMVGKQKERGKSQ